MKKGILLFLLTVVVASAVEIDTLGVDTLTFYNGPQVDSLLGLLNQLYDLYNQKSIQLRDEGIISPVGHLMNLDKGVSILIPDPTWSFAPETSEIT